MSSVLLINTSHPKVKLNWPYCIAFSMNADKNTMRAELRDRYNKRQAVKRIQHAVMFTVHYQTSTL
jgi:hypothetical protein